MNTRNRYYIRPLWVAGLALCLLVAGCSSSSTGPSEDKVREDLSARLTMLSHGLLRQNSFELNERDVLSEDRVKIHIIVGYKLDPQEAQAAKNSMRLFGAGGSKLRQAKRNDGKKEELTVLYRRTGADVWQLQRIMAGYQ